jgi:uncharacterized protein YbjT (DUF2867 family)
MKIRAIITGSTGMVGEGVLHECLNHPEVEKVLIINRRSLGLTHPKLEEIIHKDFYNITPIQDHLVGYNACFFCLGVSSVGMKEPDYYKVTHDLTLNFAQVLVSRNKDMVFGYVSGSGTDSTEKGRSMWARVKGKTENDLMKLPFKKVYAYRPAFMKPTPGLKNTLKLYRYVNWLFPVLLKIFPKYVSTLKEIGLGMIQSVLTLPRKNVLEVEDLVELSKRK